MIVRARYIHRGIEVEVVDHPGLKGRRATGRTIVEAVENLTAALRSAGFCGPVYMWRRAP